VVKVGFGEEAAWRRDVEVVVAESADVTHRAQQGAPDGGLMRS